jgi:predicted nucleic acid-binding protein
MPVIDTSAWIEFLLDTPLGREMAPHFDEPSRCVVPTIVQLELMKWLTREVSEEAGDRVIAFTETCDVAPMDTRVALRAADLCRLHRLATADAIVYATALERQVEVITCDAHFEGLEGVVYHAKANQR